MIGTAFHSSLEHLAATVAGASPREAAIRAVDEFRGRISDERARADGDPRMQGIPWPHERCDRAERALALLAYHAAGARTRAAKEDGPRHEVRLTTDDGFLVGVLDMVDAGSSGVTITDFKTAAHFDVDDLEKYQRQLLLYAYLWFDQHDEWPVAGRINFVLIGETVPIEITPERCVTTYETLRAAVANLSGRSAAELASPGEACSTCDYRPWCAPFWEWSSRAPQAERSSSVELVVERVDVDLARVTRHGLSAQLTFGTRDRSLATSLRPGDKIRIIDVAIDGVAPFHRYRLLDWSEVWWVDP